jgi:hypothetical protein
LRRRRRASSKSGWSSAIRMRGWVEQETCMNAAVSPSVVPRAREEKR